MIIPKAKLKSILDALGQSGNTIVFTNGVFDILHYGHVDYLTKAKRLGDILIVGLNTDASVRKFKGKNRPIQSEKDRARILDALKPVDYVVLFSEETPERLIRKIRPDVLVKGTDYRLNEIVGAEFVRMYGGKVKRIALQKGRSTSGIIKHL